MCYVMCNVLSSSSTRCQNEGPIPPSCSVVSARLLHGEALLSLCSRRPHSRRYPFCRKCNQRRGYSVHAGMHSLQGRAISVMKK